MTAPKPHVWKSEVTEYYTRLLVRPNRDGLMQTACRRRVTNWQTKMPNGTVAAGFSRKRDAIAAWLKAHNSNSHSD